MKTTILRTRFAVGRKPDSLDAPYHRVIDLMAALEEEHPTDAHFTMYRQEGDTCQRLTKQADADGPVFFDLIAFDADNEGHAPWENIEAIHAAYDAFKKVDGMPTPTAWYASKGGYRAIFCFENPVGMEKIERILRGMIEKFP